MKLYHHSTQPFTLEQRTYLQDEHFKPKGLWLSVEDGSCSWEEWCKTEDFNLSELEHKTEVIIDDMTRVLHLGRPEAIDWFTHRYVYTYKQHLRFVDWMKVAGEHDGIIIAPYQWSKRLDPACMWYYGWDCASACIWNTSILSVNTNIKDMVHNA